MTNKQLIMVGIHKETVDQNGKIITPASIVKFYEDDSVDCFNNRYIASSEQIYARRNKKIDYKKLTVDDFKGSKGITENFYNISDTQEYLETIIDDGYSIKRITRHNENELADILFKHTMRYEMSKASKVLNF